MTVENEQRLVEEARVAVNERDQARERGAHLEASLSWIAEYGSRDGDLKDGWDEAMRNIALAALAPDDAEPEAGDA